MPQRPDEPNRFENLANQKPPGLVAEFYDFLRDNKKWWLLPILIVIGIFAILVALASTPAAPFIYTLF
jgi:hypothetical protein